MDLQLEYSDRNLIARVWGELDLVVADDFRTQVERALDDYNVSNIIINLAGVSFIDSSGLGVILGRYKRVALNGGQIAIVNPQPQVKKILELSGLLKIMQQFASEEEAMNQLLSA